MVAGFGADSTGAPSEFITLTLGPVQSTLRWIANERENRTASSVSSASSASMAAVVASSCLVRRRARYPRVSTAARIRTKGRRKSRPPAGSGSGAVSMRASLGMGGDARRSSCASDRSPQGRDKRSLARCEARERGPEGMRPNAHGHRGRTVETRAASATEPAGAEEERRSRRAARRATRRRMPSVGLPWRPTKEKGPRRRSDPCRRFTHRLPCEVRARRCVQPFRAMRGCAVI